MSYYNDASLVLLAQDLGKKAGSIAAQKPMDANGQMTFTRTGDTATRVASNGLIEKVRTNLVSYSEQFDNASWTPLNGSTVAANTTANPLDGLMNADTLTVATVNYSSIFCLVTGGVANYTLSIYAKKGTKDFLYIVDSSGSAARAWFNLSNGSLGTVHSGYMATMTSVGNGWYRCSLRSTTATASNYLQFGLSDVNGSPTPASAGTAYIYGAQVELSDFGPTPYIPTTSTAVSVGPLANIARIDYPTLGQSGAGGGCGKLLLEPQRTNELTFSEQLNNAAWTTLDNVSVSANVSTTLDPSGYYGADKLVEDTANSQHRIYRSFGGAGSTFSFFAKAAGRNWIAVLSNNGNFTYFDIANGTIGTVAATSTATITDYGNGWYRCSVYNTHGSFGALIQLATANNATSYLGDGTSGAFIWGCQFESSTTYATSYIPTLGAAVTRGADAAVKTGISSLIGQTEGTIFIDFVHDIVPTATNSSRIQLSDGTADNWIFLAFPNGNKKQLRLYINVGGVNQLSVYSTANLLQGRNKAAAGYKSGNLTIYLNGLEVAVSILSVGIPSTSHIDLQGAGPTGVTLERENLFNVMLFKTRLSNAQLAELTAL